jgi:hypothetical protein
MGIVKDTIQISILVQITALLIGIYAYSFDRKQHNRMLDEIMLIENVVQFVEFSFYVVVAFLITNIPTKDLAKYRYLDWSITTPLMLITTLLYFVFDKEKQERREKELNKSKSNALNTVKENKNNIIKMVLSNAGMLLVGYLQEIGNVSLQTSNIVGFSFLIYSFYILYGYAKTWTAQTLFWVMFTVWSLYGVAANYRPVIKNTAYNILDIISKNFYGIFLASLIIYGK